MTDNNDDLFGGNNDLFEKDIVPENINHSIFEKRTTFLPWHKPRKQYLRKQQWAESVSNLVDSLGIKEKNRALHYLSLPGPDLLDIRSLEPVCQHKEVKLSFLGLNNGDDDGKQDAHFNAALLNQVLSMPAIDAMSAVVPDKFEHLSKKKSIAYDRVIASRRTFDVINVDLCGTVAEAPPAQPGLSLTNAIFHLIKHQAETRTEDWILFLTTRSNKDLVHPDTMRMLVEWLNKVITEDQSILVQYLDHGFVTEAELTDGKLDQAKFSAKSHSTLFAVGIGHWIFHSLFDNQPTWRVDMLPQYGYHVLLNDPTCDMISMGFYCKRLPTPLRADPFGIAHVAPLQNAPDPAETKKNCQAKIHRRVRDSSDVDVALYNNAALYNECVDQSASLLASARYDEEKYCEFAEQDRQKISSFLEENNLVTSG
jgi:hypothetical protein